MEVCLRLDNGQRVFLQIRLEDMAKKLGVRSKNAYAQYEQGRSQPSLTKIRQFLAAMHLTLALDIIPA